MKMMLDKFFVSWMLQKVFHAFTGPLQLLMCASWLSVKLRPMIDMAFLTCLWYSFNTLGSTLEGGGSSDPFTISQRSMDANNILNLNFQKLNFCLLNLPMILVALLSNDVILRSNISFKHLKYKSFILNAFYSQYFLSYIFYTSKNFEKHSN